MQEIIEGYRLSPQQRHLWALQPAGQPTPYRAWCAARVEGPLDREVLRSALERTVARHEILHTLFRKVAGIDIPLQVIVEPAHVLAFHEHDLSDVPPCEQETRLETLLREALGPSFDLESGPIIAATFVMLSPALGRLFLCLPSLYADSVSLRNIVLDICQAYAAALHGAEAPQVPLQYVDFAQWQSDLLDAEDFALEREYWRERAASALVGPRLPFVDGYEETYAFDPQFASVRIDRDLLFKIDAFAARHETTCLAFFLACWQVLLQRITGQSDLILGVGHDNRKAEELESVLGLYAQYLPYLCRLRENMSFSELARDACADLRKMHSFQEYFGWDSMRTSIKSTDAEPFFDLCFDWNQQAAEVCAGGVSFLLYDDVAYIDRFKVRLSCVRGDSGLRAIVHYDSHICAAEDVRVLADQFYTLVCSAVSNPGDAIGSLSMMSEQSRRQVLYDFNASATQPPASRSVHQLFEQQAARTPDAVAVVFDRPPTTDHRPLTNDQRPTTNDHPFTPSPLHPFTCQRLTYHELNRRANQLAHQLRSLRVGPDVPIGLCMERSPELLVGLLGILKAGGAYVPLDPALPAERRHVLLEESRARLVVTTERQRASLAQSEVVLVCLDTDSARIAEQSAENPPSRLTSDNLVYVIFTSGSTGKPKGVAVTHDNLLNYLGGITAALDLPTGASYALLSTFAADLGNTVIFPSLCCGGCLHVLPQEYATDPKLLLAYVQQHPIDCMKIVPSHLQALLEAVSPAALLPRQWLVLGGEAATASLIARVQAAAPTCRILNHYGPTETTVGVLTHRVEGASSRQRRSTLPLGRPLPNTRAYVLDGNLQPAPIWAQGEIYIGGASVARGYLHRPDLTAERFIPNPFAGVLGDGCWVLEDAAPNTQHPLPNTRLYRTGDLARYRADGQIEFLGRIDQQVKLRGFRIELGEIEAALVQHPAVRAAVVLVREDVPGDVRLVAYVVSRIEDRGLKIEDSSSDAPDPLSSILYPLSSELRDFLKNKLPDYMLPSAFVTLDALPLTANGKLDRRALPAPDEGRPALASAYAPPQTPTQALLAGIWQQVLRLERVGIHDSFFALGGDSILSIQVVARAAQAGLAFSPKDLFQHQTIAQLATIAQVSPAAEAAPELLSGPLPLTPIQRWFFAQELPNPQHYNQALLLQPRAPLDRDCLECALQQLLQHHDALRLHFVHDATGWTAEQADTAELTGPLLELVDLAALPVDQQALALEAAAAQAQSRLDLAAGRLLRALYFDLGAAGARLLLIVHHLAVDGVSWRILLEDFQTAYQQLAQGQALRLPPKTTAFASWAQQLQTYAQRAELAAQAPYWQAMGAAAPALPLDAPAEERGGAANTHGMADTVRVALDATATRALLQEVPQAYRTHMQEVLLAALGLALADWSGARTVRVDLEGHGREELLAGVDLTRTVGWYTTLYPLRLELGRAGTELGMVLKTVKEQVRALPQRGIGYGLLRYLRTADDAGAALRAQPPAQVRFNYLGQVDSTVQALALFVPAPEPVGPLADAHNPRSYPLDITALIASEQLQVNWIYSPRLHRRATIAALAAAFLERLQALIAHCQSPQAGGYTPSDFPFVQLDQQKLDAISKLIGQIDQGEG